MNRTFVHTALFTLALASGLSAQAGPELLAVESQNRAKIAKEKIRISAQERQADAQGKSQDQSRCGSQSIGNVNTGGRIGAAPREVFVFAPNAINIVGRGGCN
jgi:uncharacterized membrane protein